MFRFTIRELVLVTVIAAMACGWWIEHRESKTRGANLYKHAQRLNRSLRQAKSANVELEILALDYATKAQKKLDLDLRLLNAGRNPKDIPYRILPPESVDWAVLREDIPRP